MSELWKRNINGKEVLFVNSSRNTRYGFAHDTEVFIDGRYYERNSAYYLNRTWERFRYQTVMRGAIIKLREDRKKRLTEEFKERHGYKKLTDKRREELKAETSNDSYIELYTAILEELV